MLPWRITVVCLNKGIIWKFAVIAGYIMTILTGAVQRIVSTYPCTGKEQPPPTCMYMEWARICNGHIHAQHTAQGSLHAHREAKSGIVGSSREPGHWSDGGKETTAASGPSLRVILSDPQRRTTMGERVKTNIFFSSLCYPQRRTSKPCQSGTRS